MSSKRVRVPCSGFVELFAFALLITLLMTHSFSATSVSMTDFDIHTIHNVSQYVQQYKTFN